MFENFRTYSIINDFKGFAEACGDTLTKKEKKLLEWCDYLSNNTKFKNIILNHFDNVTFESSNRLFQLEINNNHSYKLTYIYRSGNKYDTNKGQINGDVYTLKNWFKKRNYLK